MTLLVAVATFALLGLWTAASLGATDAAWWRPLLGAVTLVVVALGLLVVRRAR